MPLRHCLPRLNEKGAADLFVPITDELRDVYSGLPGAEVVKQHSLLQRRQWICCTPDLDLPKAHSTISSRRLILLVGTLDAWSHCSALMASAKPAAVGCANNSRSGMSRPVALRSP